MVTHERYGVEVLRSRCFGHSSLRLIGDLVEEAGPRTRTLLPLHPMNATIDITTNTNDTFVE